MHSTNTYKVKSLRFRRWSRAGYAVFVSLSYAVTIGVLAISVSTKSAHKSANTQVVLAPATDFAEHESETDITEVVLNSNKIENIIIVNTTNDKTARAYEQNLIKKQTKRLIQSNLIQPFFYFILL